MRKKIFLISLILISVFILVGCDSLLWDGMYDIKYVVSGTARSVDLTIENSSGGVFQYSNKSLPWEYVFSVKSSKYNSPFLYVSAQNNNSSGSVTVKIYIKKSIEENYALFKTSTSKGSYVISTVYGSL
ncbi:MAG: hypothetical protein PQJ49_00165 [Sphaerochaetaceae bacterium]|nr:hypothetical protein [Sphaerochaetaceae bacterium]